MPSELRRVGERLAGIIPPLVTPLRERDELDPEGLDRLIEHVIGGGVHGVFILGSTGEGPSLSDRLRRELIERTCRAVAGRVPVLVGITDTSFADSKNLGSFAAEKGARVAVLSTPYYFPLSQPELASYVERLVAELLLPVLLYNIPQMTKVRFEPDTLRRLRDLEPVIGVKDSSNDPAYLDQVLEIARARPDWSVLVGAERLLAQAVRSGAQGGICGGANVMPKLFVELYQAAVRDGRTRIAELQRRVEQLNKIYRSDDQLTSAIKGIKSVLRLRGICDDCMAEPFTRPTDVERERMRPMLRDLNG